MVRLYPEQRYYIYGMRSEGLGRCPNLNPLITPSIEIGHRKPMTINAFAASFFLFLQLPFLVAP
jgi:hypothetical protein